MTFSTVVDRLARAGCIAADAEARLLVERAPDAHTLENWICRRERGEPHAWIIGCVLFCGRQVHIEPGVYVPRRQSEMLVRRAAALLPASGRAADLCTGCGAVAMNLIAVVPDAAVVGSDLDERAARCARRNGVPTVVGDVGAPLRGDGTFDIVTAVAPYVPTVEIALLPRDVQRYEPRRALDGGGDGLTLVRRVVHDAARLLRPGGWLLLELGGTQDHDLAAELAELGFTEVDAWHDDGHLRGLAARISARST